LKQHGKKPMLCACDIYRPAAIDQLEVVGKSVNTPVFTMRESRDPEAIALAAKKEAERKGFVAWAFYAWVEGERRPLGRFS
jgi:signal recognition particle subunit SRP54